MKDLKIQIDQLSIYYPLVEDNIDQQIENICNTWNFTYLLGNYETCPPQNRYREAIGWCDNSIKLMWNRERKDMGILLYFTATGKRNYEFYGAAKELSIDWLPLFRHVNRYNGHLTRIDIAIDVFDADFTVGTILNDLNERRLVVKNRKDANIGNSVKFYGEDKELTGMYVGSRNSSSYLRIYDKKNEQLKNHNNPYYNFANNFDNWIRIEGEFTKEKAKSIGIELSKSFGDKKLMGFVLNQWNFVSANENFWDDLKKRSNNAASIPPLPPKTKNYTNSALRYFFKDGSVNVLYKCYRAFSKEEVVEFLDFIKEYIDPSSKLSFKAPNNANHDIKIMKEEVEQSGLRLMDYVNQILEEINMSH